MLTNGEIYTAYITAANQTLRPQDERIALDFARAVEQAVLSKLRGNLELPEPVDFSDVPEHAHVWGYQEAQLIDYGDRRAATAWAQAIEHVAEAVEDSNLGENMTAGRFIRAMLEAAPKEQK